jgi:hypothetical protein
MRFINETSASAGLLRTERPGDVMAAALVVRRRFVLSEGRLVERSEVRGGSIPLEPGLDAPPPERAAPVKELSEQPVSIGGLRKEVVDLGAWGELEPDELTPRVGTDVLVIGHAICPEPRIASRVELRFGPYELALDVFGDRVWEGPPGALMPSAPEPFERLPLSYARAYGGCASGDYGPVPYHKNPLGRGYHLRSGEARGKPLPNVELAGAHVSSWDDRPDPVGLAPYPALWGLRTERTVRVLEAEERVEIHPEGGMFDRAHPLLSGKLAEPGPFTLTGMTPTGALRFEVPPCPYAAEISLGADVFRRDLQLEELLVDLRPLDRGGEPVVELSYRKMFRYPYLRQQRRELRLVPLGVPAKTISEGGADTNAGPVAPATSSRA